MPIDFRHSEINISGDNNLFDLKQTNNPVSGAIFRISDSSSLIIGKNSELSNNPMIIANNGYKSCHKIVIGDDVRIALGVLIRNSDGQAILDFDTNEAINEPDDIIIGNHCWLMTRTMLVKGTKLPDNTAVAPYSFVNKKFDEEYTMIAGIPAQVKKRNFKFDVLSYKKYMLEHCNKG